MKDDDRFVGLQWIWLVNYDYSVRNEEDLVADETTESWANAFDGDLMFSLSMTLSWFIFSFNCLIS
jgi:hypothetical protein